MFSAGLSFDQAPPISVVLRFFLTVPLFGIAAGMLMIDGHSALLLGVQGPLFVALVHLILLGMAALTMTGALFQMLPVIAGATVENPLANARIIHLLLSTGTVFIAAAFWSETFVWLGIGALLAASTLLFFALTMLGRLRRVENKTPAVEGMMLALASLAVAAFGALAMGFEFAGGQFAAVHEALRQIHLHFMLFGWIVGLITAVAFQVIEMFYVTPPYPVWMQRFFLKALLGVLLLQSAAFLLPWHTRQ